LAAAAISRSPVWAQDALAKLYEEAKKEGELTWYTAHYTTETAESVGRDFGAKFPGVKCNVVRTTAQVAYQRLLQDIKNNAPVCDVFSSTDEGHYVRLKGEKRFADYVAPNASKLLPQFQGFDPDNTYFATAAGMNVLVYNTGKVKAEDAPKNWPDLLDPKWKGQISTGHPGFSGYVGTWVVQMRKLYGWDFFKKLEKNKPQIGRSVNDPVTVLNSGERNVGVSGSNTIGLSAAKGNPIAISYATDGSVLMITPSAVMANAPHPNAARLFMNYLLGEDHARVSVAEFGYPVIAGIEAPKGLKGLNEIKVIRPTTQEILKGIPEVIEEWRDTFGN
jgi:iron(III) transport system substrate-binding protein